MSFIKRLLGNNKEGDFAPHGGEEPDTASFLPRELSAYERAQTLGAHPRRVVRIYTANEQIFNHNFTSKERIRTRRSDRWKPPTPAHEAPVYEAPVYETPAYETPAYEAPAFEAPALPTAYSEPLQTDFYGLPTTDHDRFI